jgi:hypothetical protein
MAQTAKDYRSVDIPDSGHPLTTEQYRQFIEVTSSFLGVRS